MAVLTTEDKARLKRSSWWMRLFGMPDRWSKLDADGTYTGTISGTATNLDLGDATTPTAGSLDVFPAASGGANDKLTVTALTNGANRGLGIVNRAMGQATTLGIPDPGAANGEFLLTNSAHQVIVSANGSDRTVSLNGNITLAGGLTSTGAFTPTLAFGGNDTITFPAGGGTVAYATGAETGTSNATFEINNTGNSLTLSASGLTGDYVFTFPDGANGTVVTLAATQTLAAKTLTAPVVNGMTTAAAANNFTLNTGSGAFTTPTGTFTHYGNVASNGNITFNFSGSNGTFATSTGVNTLSGDVVVAPGKQIDVGTAAGGGDATPLRLFSATAANGVLVVKCQDDANNNTTTLQSGDPGAGANPTITLPILTCTLPGLGLANAWTGTADFQGNISASAGNPNVNFSASSGTFDTTTGTCQINGAGGVTINGATTPCVSCATGKTNTGYVQVLGKTSGGIKLTSADAAVAVVTLSAGAQTDPQTITIPDTAGAAKNMAYGDSAGNIAAANLASAVQDLVPTATITAAAEAAHARTITVQVKDAAGNNLTEFFQVRMWVTAAGDYGVPSATGTDTFGAPSAGAIFETITAKADYRILTDTDGKYVFALTHNDAGSNRYVMVEIGGRVYSSGAIAFDAV